MLTRLLRTIAAAIALLFLVAAAPAGDGPVLRLSDGKRIGFDGMAEELVRSRVIFVGEVHNVPAHHLIELEIIRRLHESFDVPFLIGLEMFRSENQQWLDQWVAGSLDEAAFRKQFERNWSHSWPLYRDIFLYAREHRIPLLGLNVDEGITAKVARSGFSSLTPEERAKLPRGITCSVDETYEEFIRRAHGNRQSGQMFRHFCEAQMVWDSAMAKTLEEALAREPRRKAVVLAGSGHAWRHGIPAQFSRSLPGVQTSVVLPVIDGEMTPATITRSDADFLVE